jgi:hypothetical protein
MLEALKAPPVQPLIPPPSAELVKHVQEVLQTSDIKVTVEDTTATLSASEIAGGPPSRKSSSSSSSSSKKSDHEEVDLLQAAQPVLDLEEVKLPDPLELEETGARLL